LHEITVTILRILYGDDLLANLSDIETRFSISELRDVVAILFPRRSGKTKTETIVAACFAVSQAIGNGSCYNIGARQSRDWLKKASMCSMCSKRRRNSAGKSTAWIRANLFKLKPCSVRLIASHRTLESSRGMRI
jgi:hypothetical protein